MRKKMALSVIAIALAMLLGFGSAYDEANADAILFPWIVKSGAISTIVSVVNTAALDPLAAPFTGVEQLHWSYYYKHDGVGGIDNSQTASCAELNFKMTTSPMDVVTVDASGNINAGLPMFGDTNNVVAGGTSAALSAFGDRRAFLIVDNNTPLLNLATQGANNDGTLYGEAMVLEIDTGAAWGYVAYNSGGPFGNSGGVGPWAWTNPAIPPYADGQNGFVSFSNALDPHGEVIGELWTYTPPALFGLPGFAAFVIGEIAPVVLMPPAQIATRMFMTPVDSIAAAFQLSGDPTLWPINFAHMGQRFGNLNSRISVCADPRLTDVPAPWIREIDGRCNTRGIILNDESPLSSTRVKDIVCTSADDISQLLDPGTMTNWLSNGGQAWTYMDTTMGGRTPYNQYMYTPNMMIGKLEWIDGSTTISGTAVSGTFNNFIQIRNNKDNMLAGPGSAPFGINNLRRLP
jgi:hypothetical protein